MSDESPAPRGPGVIVLLLYAATLLGIVAAFTAALMDADGALRFTLAALCLMGSARCAPHWESGST